MILYNNTITKYILILFLIQLICSQVNSFILKSKKTFSRSRTSLSDISQSIRREDFPILEIDAYPDKKLVYLDSAASSQKPIQVLNKVLKIYIYIYINYYCYNLL